MLTIDMLIVFVIYDIILGISKNLMQYSPKYDIIYL